MRAILTYHSIDTSGSPISCHPDAFARQVAWLGSGRVHVTTIDALMQLPDSVDAVAITFDDGFVNFGDEAAPRLLEHGLPVTLFVVGGLVGGTNSWDAGPRRRTPDLPLLDWPALVHLQKQGVTLGAHGMTHRSLSGLAPGEVDEEVRGSADVIEARTGRRPAVFAYPFGHHTAASTEAVARVFRWACTTEFRPIGATSEACALPRLDMGYFGRTGSLDGWGTPAFRARLGVRNSLRRIRRTAATLGGRRR